MHLIDLVARVLLAAPSPAPTVVPPGPRFVRVEGLTATATSTLPKSGRVRYDPIQLLLPKVVYLPFDPEEDDVAEVRLESAWCEAAEGLGADEAVTFAFETPVALGEVEIAAGVWLSEKYFRANARIVELVVETDDGQSKRVTVPEDRELASVELAGTPVGKMTLRVAKVARHAPHPAAGGAAWDDACISGVRVKGVHLVKGLSREAVAALPAFFDRWDVLKDSQTGLEVSDAFKDGTPAAAPKVDAFKAALEGLVSFPLASLTEAAHTCGTMDDEGRPARAVSLRNADAWVSACMAPRERNSWCRDPDVGCACDPRDSCPGQLSPVDSPRRFDRIVSAGKDRVRLAYATDADVAECWTIAWQAAAWKLAKVEPCKGPVQTHGDNLWPE